MDAAGGLFDLATATGSPTLAMLGLDVNDLADAASRVMDELPPNPSPVGPDDVLSILHAAYQGRRPTDRRETR